MGLIECPTCGKFFQSLGYPRHRTMHYEWREREAAKKKEKEKEKLFNHPTVGKDDNG